ncbi:hypothetical protein KUCAC02_032110, partial [Chaenocephalus aceratus]
DANVAKALAWGCCAVAHSPRPSSWMDGVFVCKRARVNAYPVNFPLFATVCACVARPEGTRCNGRPTGRKRENDET